ncbi:MAG: S-adenosylmethionine:tRNA ribosyltransferase-isomerase [Vicingaceae bacterium]|jgi:S-adenosylmethionine:tRNA ribosyltransferase-isomerase
MNREQLESKDFFYDLPDEQIAKHPLDNRNSSKLLTYKNGSIEADVFSNLKAHLPEGAVLVFNDTKVLAARLYFQRKTGAKIEIFCLEPFEQTVEQALTSKQECNWQCLIGNLKRVKDGEVLEMAIAGTILRASISEKRATDVIIHFEWDGGIEFSEILNEVGEIPLPPYLNRKTELADQENYQTVYAKNEGAVAAPTAGLHFIDSQLEDLEQNGFDLAYLTLFVGAGTFRSVKADKLVDHDMHQERIVIEKATIEQLAKKQDKIICVGTTSLRSLESLYWLAVKMKHTGNANENMINQDDAYQLPEDWGWKDACEYLLGVLEETGETKIDFHSALFIMPGYQWKAINGLITNFHQPKSTLLALVSAWIGEDWHKVYNYALNNDFRFLSYGDSSILLKD